MANSSAPARSLRRILGLGFGLAVAFGGTVGAGILRLPGTLAAALGDARLIVLFWILGGIYALLGAVAVAELSAMMPRAGGFYVFARRAFGGGTAFVVGWSDWLNSTAAVAYVSMTAATFLGALWPVANDSPRLVALAIVALFTAIHWIGLRMSSSITTFISVLVGLMLMGLVVACFVVTPMPATAIPAVSGAANSLPLFSFAMVGAVVTALRSVLLTFDGWYSPIYFAEENTDPARTMPRAIIGGTLLIALLYLIINIAFLRVLPIPVLAASQLPAADAARLVMPNGGAVAVTVISLVTVLSLINSALMLPPRILLAIGRDGLFTSWVTNVSPSGTPRVALGLTSATAALLVVSGTFEQIAALATVLFVFNYLSAYAAMFALRRRDPNAERPYRAFGFPVSTAIVLIGSVLYEAAAFADDWRYGIAAGVLVIAVVVLYLSIRRQASRRAAGAPP